MLAAGALAGCSGDDGPERSVDAFLAGWRSGDLDAVGFVDADRRAGCRAAEVSSEIKELSGDLAGSPPTLTRRASRRSPRDIATAPSGVDWTLPGGSAGRTTARSGSSTATTTSGR